MASRCKMYHARILQLPRAISFATRAAAGHRPQWILRATPPSPQPWTQAAFSRTQMTQVQAKLARSLVAAASFADACPKEKRRGSFVPFRFQRKVDGEELAFTVGDGVFVDLEYGAADVGLLRGLGVSLVINVTTGSRLVPNFGESVEGFDASYAEFSPGRPYRARCRRRPVRHAQRLCPHRNSARAKARRVFVHCSADSAAPPHLSLLGLWLVVV